MSVVDEVLTPEEAIRFVGLDRDECERDPRERLRNLTRFQGLPAVRAGRYTAYRRSDLEKWLRAKTVGAAIA